MVAMNRPDTAALAKRFAARFLLRLDNGALLGEGSTLDGESAPGPIIMPPDQAYARGRLQSRHADALEDKLHKVHQTVPGARPLRSVSGGTSKQARAEPFGQQPAPKRQRADPSVGTAAHAGAARRAPPSPTSQDVSSWHGGEFKDKCASIVREVISGLGLEGPWFSVPVDGKAVPDYHSIISKPMDLGTLQRRLASDTYSSPKEFCEDMRLIWRNCSLYNGHTSLVGKAGIKGSNIFEQLWAGSGFSDESRSRRANAGVAAPKYEPAVGIPEKKPKKSLNGPPKKSIQRSKSKGGLAWSRSSASFHAYSNRPMDRERKQILAETVQNLDESQIESVMQLLRDAGVPQSETGECELDFDVMENSVLWELDELLLGASGGGQRSNGHLESDTDSDSE